VKLEFKNVEFHHGGTHPNLVFENLNLKVGSGELLGVIGPSGSGKTSLLRMIAGLAQPTKGALVFSGGNHENRPRCLMAFQNSGLFPWLSVLDNICIGLEAQGVGRSERMQRATAMLERISLGHVAHHLPHELSGGMRQRIALVRLLVSDGDVLLLDEPLSAVDAQTRKFLQQELLDLWSETPKTTVYVTHDIEEALTLSDRVIVLSARSGNILADIVVPTPRPRVAISRPKAEIEALRWDIWALLAQNQTTADQGR